MRYMTPSEKPIVKTATDSVATVTWMASHTERSDGISSRRVGVPDGDRQPEVEQHRA